MCEAFYESTLAVNFLVEQPWAHEIAICDPDGNRLRIGTPKG